MAAYCSPENLPEDYESIPGFFSVLEQGETHHRERMNDWLDHVALAIANVRCVICADVVIGGEAALYLDTTTSPTCSGGSRPSACSAPTISPFG